MDYYQILGVSQDATQEEVRDAYRKLSMKFHPDKNNGDKYFEDWSKKINEAYDTLGNPNKRGEYDRSKNGTNNNSGNNNRNQYNGNSEQDSLSYLKRQYSDYKTAKNNYRWALNEFRAATDIPKPNHFSFVKISVGVIGILIALLGLKNTYGTSSNEVLQQTETSASTIEEETSINNAQDRYVEEYQNTAEKTEIDFFTESEVINQDLILPSPKAFFYDSPLDKISNGAYLVKGDKITVTRQYNDFGYTEFINSEGVTTKGWVKMSQFEVYSPLTDDNMKAETDTQIRDEDKMENTESNPKKKKGLLRKIFGKKNKD